MIPVPESPAIDAGLLRSRPSVIYVEMTSRCNLRCVYCAVSQPEYRGEDLQVDVDALGELLVELQPVEVQFSGHGETTMLREWAPKARKLLARGLPLTITSNFAKHFDDDEIDVLSRMHAVKISIDSADAATLGQLRRGARLQTLEDNVQRLVRRCRDDSRERPFLHLSCTVTDVNVPQLAELVRWAHRHEAHAVMLLNLVRYPDLDGALRVRHPAEVDALGARKHLAEAQRVAAELGIRVDLEPGLVDALKEDAGPWR